MSAHLDEETLAALAFDPASADGSTRDHLSRCEACQREVRANQSLLREVAALPAPTPSPAALERTKNEVVARMRTQARQAPVARDWVTAVVLIATSVAALLFLADVDALTHRAPFVLLRWALALAALGVAASLEMRPAQTRRQAVLTLGGTLGLSLALAAADLATQAVGIGEHSGCQNVIALVSVAPLASGLFYLGSHPSAGSADGASSVLRGAIGGAAGALAGQAVLMTTCASPEGLLHVLGFHVLALLAVTATGALLGRAVDTFRTAR